MCIEDDEMERKRWNEREKAQEEIGMKVVYTEDRSLV
jgi:hypothetical protein